MTLPSNGCAFWGKGSLPPRLPPQTLHRASVLAHQDQGLRFGGGNHRSGAREGPTVAGPNPKPQSWLAAVTIPTRTRTLTLTLTLKH